MTDSRTVHSDLTRYVFPSKWKRWFFFSRQITKCSFEFIQSCRQICKIKKVLTALQLFLFGSICYARLLDTCLYLYDIKIVLWKNTVKCRSGRMATSLLCNLMFNEIYFPFFRYGNFPLWCKNRPVYQSGFQLLCLATPV